MLSNFRPIGENTGLESKYLKLFEWTAKMLSYVKNLRPNCEEIFSERVSWGLSLTELKNNGNYEIRSDSSDKFYLRFIDMKSKSKKLFL